MTIYCDELELRSGWRGEKIHVTTPSVRPVFCGPTFLHVFRIIFKKEHSGEQAFALFLLRRRKDDLRRELGRVLLTS